MGLAVRMTAGPFYSLKGKTVTFSLYDAFVPTAVQTLDALPGVIALAQQHVADTGCSDEDMYEARLAETMWPLPWHIRSCWMHGAYTLDQLAGGEFTPDFTEIPADWDEMLAMIQVAKDRLMRCTREEVTALADREIAFVLGGVTRFTLTGERFLLGFNMPNFQFHATTFYGILRMQGVPLTKRDYMGDPAATMFSR